MAPCEETRVRDPIQLKEGHILAITQVAKALACLGMGPSEGHTPAGQSACAAVALKPQSPPVSPVFIQLGGLARRFSAPACHLKTDLPPGPALR